MNQTPDTMNVKKAYLPMLYMEDSEYFIPKHYILEENTNLFTHTNVDIIKAVEVRQHKNMNVLHL